MADIVRRESTQLPVRRAREWDPFQPMREMMRWDPFREVTQLMREFDPFYRTQGRSFVPDFDVRESPNAFTFRADLPGVREEDVDIQVSGNRLTISGRREREEEEESDTFYCCERSYGAFTRTFSLPEGVKTDQISADMRNGILNLHIPKSPEAQPKRIAIKPTRGDGGKARA